MGVLIIVSILVIVLSALASGSEAALFSVTLSKARAMAAAKKPGGEALLAIKQDMPRTIATIVILNNISNIVGSGIIGAIAANVFGSPWLGIFFAVFTLLIILLAEIIPKTLGEVYAHGIAAAIAGPVRVLRLIFAPILWVIERIVHPFHRGRKRTVTEDEIKVMARISREHGVIEQDESKMIQRIFRLNDITAEDMMTPRLHVQALPADLTLMELRPRIIGSRHSRMPVYDDSLDHVLGVVLARDLLAALAQDRFAARPTDYLQEPSIVSHDMLADDLLIHFQKQERHLAVVVDENRKMVGVVTLEDVLEELVGEITDETDVRPEFIRRVSKEEIMVDEATEVAQINDFFNVDISYDGPVSDYVTETFARKLKSGDVFRENGLEYRIVSMRRTRPKLISIRKTATDT